MMGIDVTGAPKLMPGETLLNPCNHRVDAGLTVTSHQGVEVVGVFGPRPRDQAATARGIGFIPNGKIAIDDVGVSAHVNLHAGHRWNQLRFRSTWWPGDCDPSITSQVMRARDSTRRPVTAERWR